MDIEAIIKWYILYRMLSKPSNFPGKHNIPQPRTSQSLKPLETDSQVY